ncbi:hypothetical protein TNCV_1278381 [Trichonephila clavipes]|nr:hypothetical protein TNCV_1278381 [Trichonephila clavipes]
MESKKYMKLSILKNFKRHLPYACGSSFSGGGWVDTPCNYTYLTTKHIPVHDGILIDFQVTHNECILALAETICGQTQDNSHTKPAFAKSSALS